MTNSTNKELEEMPLVTHLIELRNCLMRMLIAVLIVFAGLAYFANDIYTLVAQPLLVHLPENTSMIATEVASPFLAPFKLTFLVSAFLVAPYLLYQLWSFIAPAMYQSERRLAVPLLVSSVVLFYAGIAFAYFVVFPLIFQFFTAVAPEGVTVMTDISHYLSFVMKLFFAFGLAFEVPIATILLVLSGITTVEKLSKSRPYVIVGAFVLGMLLTPPDIFSQSFLAIPIWLLFEIGLFFSKWIAKKEAPEEAAAG